MVLLLPPQNHKVSLHRTRLKEEHLHHLRREMHRPQVQVPDEHEQLQDHYHELNLLSDRLPLPLSHSRADRLIPGDKVELETKAVELPTCDA